MTGQIMMYYGKEYGLVFSSTSRKRTNTIAHMLNIYFKFDYGPKEGTVKGNVVLLNHDQRENKCVVHQIFVKKPYDKVVKTVLGKQ